ncbi:winged helix domain-containing protein [Thaumasiovibrio sp. DFM-14]|uniref:ribosomal protein uL16 3-hydroxylase n=1 Tax=Thaumasiovibrio sp. DFM-14 TaxID=3384792 RepID=UPI0039A08C3C
MKLNINFDQFLDSYWQQKPIHYADAVTPFHSLLSPDELAGLAVEEEVNAQLIYFINDKAKIKTSPIDFNTIPENAPFQLAVHAVNHWLPATTEFVALFNALPNWLLSDLSVCYCMKAHHMAAHADRHERLIVQQQGCTVWQIGPPQDLATCGHSTFTPEQEFILNPGDMLYIPAFYAASSQTLENSMSYSMNYRTPFVSELIASLSDHLLHDAEKEPLFKHHTNKPRHAHNAISAQDFSDIEEMLTDLLHQQELLKTWLGEHLSTPLHQLDLVSAEQPWHLTEIRDLLLEGKQLHKINGLKALYHTDQPENLYINGEQFSLPTEWDSLGAAICDSPHIDKEILGLAVDDPGVLAFLTEVVNIGYWYSEE